MSNLNKLMEKAEKAIGEKNIKKAKAALNKEAKKASDKNNTSMLLNRMFVFIKWIITKYVDAVNKYCLIK